MAMGLRAWMRTGRKPNPVASRPAASAPEGGVIRAPLTFQRNWIRMFARPKTVT